MIAALLALLAAGLLALGYFADMPNLGGVALALSALSLGLVVFSTVRRVRDESPEDVVSPESPEEVADVKAEEPQVAAAPLTEHSQPAAEIVLIVRGRRRYHQSGCDLLAAHDAEELTEDEAREEGFTACTRCVTP